jgi:hypothetical protein
MITGARQRLAQRAFEGAELARDKAFERRVLTRHLPPDGPSVVHGADVGSIGIFSRGGTVVLINLMCEVELFWVRAARRSDMAPISIWVAM